jgi:hypothetical protein
MCNTKFYKRGENMIITGMKETYKLVFKTKEDWYREQIKLALEGKIGAGGFIHTGIILYINAQNEFISKAMIYITLEGFIQNKNKIDASQVLVPENPLKILKLAKKYINREVK